MNGLINALLTVFFVVLSVGAFLDRRGQALPLAVIFLALAIYSGFKTMKQLRGNR